MNDEITTSTEQEVQENSARKHLLIFWIRMIGWLATGVGAPIGIFAAKFGLFNSIGYQITVDELGNVTASYTAINGWGIISCVLVGIAVINILKEVIDAYSKKYSLAKQCLVGLKNKIIPIAIAIVVLVCIRNVIDYAIFCLTVIGCSQIIAIPLNPLPEWKSRVKDEEDYRDLLSNAAEYFKLATRKKGDK